MLAHIQNGFSFSATDETQLSQQVYQ